MASNPTDFALVQGDSFVKIVTIEDDNGDPIDLTGLTIKGSVRKDYGSSVLCDFTISARDDVNGTFTMSLTPAQTAALPVPQAKFSFVYDLQTANSGLTSIKTYLFGSLRVRRQVTLNV